MATHKNKKYKPRKKSAEEIPEIKKRGRTKQDPEEIPADSDLLSAEEIIAKNKEIENAPQAKSIEEKIDFPEGVFTPPKKPEIGADGKPLEKPTEPAKVNLHGKPFNLTIAVDTFVGIVCMFIIKRFDPSLLDLTEDEKIYFSDLEEKCGIKFEIGSPWFYFGALGMTYMGKIKAIVLLNRMMKEEEEAKNADTKETEKKLEEIAEKLEDEVKNKKRNA